MENELFEIRGETQILNRELMAKNEQLSRWKGTRWLRMPTGVWPRKPKGKTYLEHHFEPKKDDDFKTEY